MNDYKAELEKNNVLAFVPGGNSMWPTLKNEGQSVIITKPQGRLKLYDVALFERENGVYVLHRVIKVLPDGYVFVGDSQYVTETVEEKNIVGVMKGFYRGKKYIDCQGEKYKKAVKRWFSHKLIRKIRLKLFYFSLRVKKHLKKGE